VSVDSSYPVQDFLEALTSQLDRTQDALRLKAVNRPLTYAIRDFALNLQVFVELDDQGEVRFRSAGPNDSGASTVSVGFTTITRPMIEENTVALTEVQGQSLDDLGLDAAEQRSLEKVGVRNAAQLRRLNSSSGEGALAQFADLPVNRLRAALQASRPAVHTVEPEPSGASNGGPNASPPETSSGDRPVRLPQNTRRIRLEGANLQSLATSGAAELDGVGVPIVSSGSDHAVIDLGHRDPRGRLEVRLDDGEVLAFQLGVDDTAADPWRPE
jgi:hypothetical protein